MAIRALQEAQNPVPVIKKYDFPFRLPVRRLAGLYASLEEAFAAHDYLYVARFGADDPELKGCALIMLGNRMGGERILGRHNIRSTRSSLYRAFGAWQHDDPAEARRWVAEGRAIGGNEAPLDKLAALIERQNFRVVFHCDFDGHLVAGLYKDLPGFDVIVTRHLQTEGPGMLPLGQPLASIIPKGPPIDFVLLDDLKMVPTGIGDLNAPVIVNTHDNEWYDSFLDRVMPEIDFVSVGASSDLIEIARPFGCPGAVYFYHFPFQMPPVRDFTEGFSAARDTDLFYSSSDIGNDFYRYKRQDILSLADLDPRFAVKIASRSYPFDEYWRHLRGARFSISSFRCGNILPARPIEALCCGTLHLVEEENGFPYLFSEPYHCFPVYRHAHMRADVEKHLGRYQEILAAFRPQLPQFEREFNGILPLDAKTRALRYLRHLLFMTYVEEKNMRARVGRKKPERSNVYTDQYDYLIPFPAQLERFIAQTPPEQGLRRAFAEGRLAQARGLPVRESLEALLQSIRTAVAACPDSLALHYTRGLCQRLLGMEKEAEESFARVTSGELHLMPDDQTTARFGRFNSLYWISDAHIRARRPKELEPFAAVEDVWLSYAWANRADLALHRAFAQVGSEAAAAFAQVTDFAERALDLLIGNDAAQRVYLRAAFALSAFDEKWSDVFLQSFEAARRNDHTFLHDFAAPAVHLLTARKRLREAKDIIGDLKRFLDRVELRDSCYALYPEMIPFLYRYGIPHKKLEKIS